ncbi:MAG: hypothetical protein RIT27_1770 [Pseudomonadota bacterium]|jgi:ribonucleoside-diphosphate reductase alpha chain
MTNLAKTFEQYRVIKRNGQVVAFDAQRIVTALTKAFLAAEHNQNNNISSVPPRIKTTVLELADKIMNGLKRRLEFHNTVHIEDIQDQVELELMRAGEHKIARDYVLYREHHAQQRAAQPQPIVPLQVTDIKGILKPLNEQRLHKLVEEACFNLEDVNPNLVVSESLKNIFDGISESEINRVLVMTARMFIEKEPNYTYVAARLLLDSLRTDAFKVIGKDQLPNSATAEEMTDLYKIYFPLYIQTGLQHELLSPLLKEFDLEKLAAALIPERDFKFTYLGFQTLFDRYFLHWEGTRFELPQAFFMRVAMGLSLNEQNKEDRAIEFYRLLSSFDFMSSTPTLFNSATPRSQLSSCYLTTISDDLAGIYNAIRDNALLSKFAGGLGNDWSSVRAMGSRIKGTNGKSQGVVPFMKVANDTLVAVNQCFAPETLIYTANGVKPIKEINKGELVLGQRGEYREVLEKFSYLHCQNPMVEIKVKHSILPLKVSNQHPFWAIQNIPLEQAIDRTKEWLAKGKIKPNWIDASDLKKGDYVAQVIPKEINNIECFTEDDARLYGIMLGDGHCSKDGFEWGVSGNPQKDTHLTFVENYLEQRQIHYWIANRDQSSCQIRWASGRGVVKDGTTGRIVSAGAPTLPFNYHDLYNAEGKKYISRRFSHLPPAQTLALIQGLLETDGGISRNKEIYFTNTSQHLVEGLRYQCLRLGIPVAGQYRERNNEHTGTRQDGTKLHFKGITKVYDLRIPAIPMLAEKMGCQPLTKYNWFEYQGCLFSRVISVEESESLPIIYDLKVEGDETYMTTAALVHNGGRRKGSGCAYLETWHLDIEEFLELRKNTGDERRRTHDMNTANWIPDLFMIRVQQDAEWTLFSPDETPDLHELYGKAFEQAYLNYEAKVTKGEIKSYKKISAVALWRKMLTMLFETGHPWVTFKDPCNIRSPQQHDGVVHSSNLCCIAADQRVVTDRGLLTIGELYKLGEKNKVVGLDGVYNASEMLLPRPNAPMVCINTKEGYSHKVTPDHKVWVKDIGWIEAQHLKLNDKLLIQQLEGLWGAKHNPELSYMMGLIAGDGTFDGEKGKVYVDIWENDFKYLQPVEETVHYLLEGNTVLKTTSTNTPSFSINSKQKRARLSSTPLYRLLEQEGFTAETKLQIPQLVWQGDRETVAAYLKGLYQADGNLVSSHEVTTLALASVNLPFIQELQILWANFGVKTSINQMRDHEFKPMPDGKGGTKEYWSKPLYRLLITSIRGCQIAEEITQFATNKSSDAAKQYLANLNKEGYQQKLYATFSGLTELPNEDAYCLMVDSETHAWTVNGLITKNTEITLNTSEDSIAVCNLGSINLPAHIDEKGLNQTKLAKTIQTAMRMLDNVIDINYYAVPQAEYSNLKHRPVGLGIMGFQDALYKLRIPYASKQAIDFADKAMELISYYAIEASMNLAKERGHYSTFEGSLWSKGILPIDTLQMLKENREQYLDIDFSQRLDWSKLREEVKRFGMRNSNCMAIAPTATISNICGVTQSIEPTYQNLFVKSNLSGEFTVVNPYLAGDLKKLGLWDEVMVNDLKYFDGSVQAIDRVPNELKKIYATAFEMDSSWLIEAAARRQKWLDQAQSLNLYMKEPSGSRLDNLYRLAWLRGLKTTYYLRSLGATHVEKNTVKSRSHLIKLAPTTVESKACSIDDPECEACQ